MKRFVISVLLFTVIPCWANAASSRPLQARPAATFSQFQCTGFIAAGRPSSAIRLYNGADNDLFEALHSFTQGDFVYLRGAGGKPIRVGEAFSIIRPESGFLLNFRWLPGMIQGQILPPASRYRGQRTEIKRLGHPYDNMGLVRVVKVTPQAAIAKVVFACSAMNPRDIAVPYVPQAVPDYFPHSGLRRFAPPNGKLQGSIVAVSAASAFLGKGSIAFLDVGKNQGVKPGQIFRIYAVFRDNVAIGLEGLFPPPPTPRETVGELVVLHVQDKAAEGIVVKSLREIAVGDGVELE